MGVFARMMEGLAAEGTAQKTVMIDATCLKAHRTASSLRGSSRDQRTVQWTVLPKNGDPTTSGAA